MIKFISFADSTKKKQEDQNKGRPERTTQSVVKKKSNGGKRGHNEGRGPLRDFGQKIRRGGWPAPGVWEKGKSVLRSCSKIS